MGGIPLRHLIATALLGDQEGIESVLLPDIFSSGGARNLSIDKFGRVAQILGYLAQNATPVTTHTGAAATLLRALFHYTSQSGGVVTRQEIGIFDDGVSHWEFRTSTDTGATWTFVSDYGATSTTRIPDFAQSGNLLFMTNGVIAPAQWDGSNLTTAGGTQLAAPTFTSTGAGALSGNVSWRVLPMVGNVRKLSSVQSSAYSITAATGAGHIDWTADADVTVTGYEIYRTTGTGAIFFFEGYVSGRLIVTFGVGAATDTDALLLGGRVMQEFGDAPPVGAYFCEPHKQRMVYLRTDANPRTAYISDPGIPYSVYSAFNSVDFTDAEAFSDTCTGATGDFLGMLIVWLERSIWRLSGTFETIGAVIDRNRLRTNAQTGTVSHRTVARIPAGAVYSDAEGTKQKTAQVTLAYLTPLNDIRLFDGSDDTVISHPKKTTLSAANYGQRTKSFHIHDRARQEVTWVYATGSANEPNVGVCWNYRWGTWYTRDWPFACGLEVETPQSASVLLAGEALTSVGGYCYMLWSGYTFNGANITSQWMTKVLYGEGSMMSDAPGLPGKPLLSIRKRWRWADFLFDVVGGIATLTIEWIPGDDAGDLTPALGSTTLTIPLSQLETSDGSPIESSDFSLIQVQSTPALLRAKLQTRDTAHPQKDGQYVHSRGLRLRVSITTTSAQWFLSCLDVAYQPLAGEKRTVGRQP